MVLGVFLNFIHAQLNPGWITVILYPICLRVPWYQPGGVKKLRKGSFTVKHKVRQFAYCKCRYFQFPWACFGAVGGYCSTQRKQTQTLGAAANNSSNFHIPIDAQCQSNEANVNNDHYPMNQRETSCSSQPLPLLPCICNHVLTLTLLLSAWSQDFHFQTGFICGRPDRPAEVGTAGPE